MEDRVMDSTWASETKCEDLKRQRRFCAYEREAWATYSQELRLSEEERIEAKRVMAKWAERVEEMTRQLLTPEGDSLCLDLRRIDTGPAR